MDVLACQTIWQAASKEAWTKTGPYNNLRSILCSTKRSFIFMPSPQPEAPKAINVHALFPIVVVPGVELDLRAVNWRWVHCLHLLLTTFNALNLSRRPYRWILYAIGVVVGAQGYLSPHIYPHYVDLDFTGPLTESANLYYFITNAERRRMFPVDPDIERTHVTSSVHIAREGQFHDGVADRDVRSCVLADMSESNCDAVHLLAHSDTFQGKHGKNSPGK